MGTIKDCVLSFWANENIEITKVKITRFYRYQPSFEINNKTIVVELYEAEYDEEVCEFYDANNTLVHKAKGFSSLI